MNNKQDDERPDHGQEKPPRVIVGPCRSPEKVPDEAPYERSVNSMGRSCHEAHGVWPMHDWPSNQTCDKAHDDLPDDVEESHMRLFRIRGVGCLERDPS